MHQACNLTDSPVRSNLILTRTKKHQARTIQLHHTFTIFLLLSLSYQPVYAIEFVHKLDLQVRADDRSSRQIRYQYRVRYYPSVVFDETWSAHGFVVTGDEFGSSHNTFDDGTADYVYPRRAYLRHQGTYGKTEVGIIPTFKGRVSSSGLSKDGWIRGLRHVRAVPNAQLEVVVGQLNTLDPADALQEPSEIDYVEVEYSADLSAKTSFELSGERMTQANFLRTELRHVFHQNFTGFAELVARLDESRTKFILGSDSAFELLGSPMQLTAHYAYVSEGFGLRAELTEDFLGTGHGITAELSSAIASSAWEWFVRFDGTETRSRFIAGLKWSL